MEALNMIFSLQKFFEFLAYVGGLIVFWDFFFETLETRDRKLFVLLIALLTLAVLSSFVREV